MRIWTFGPKSLQQRALGKPKRTAQDSGLVRGSSEKPGVAPCGPTQLAERHTVLAERHTVPGLGSNQKVWSLG